MSGIGWGMNYNGDDLVLSEESGFMKYAAYIKCFEFCTRWWSMTMTGLHIEMFSVLAPGGSKNSTREYALKGALTNALGTAASWMMWQLKVYLAS